MIVDLLDDKFYRGYRDSFENKNLIKSGKRVCFITEGKIEIVISISRMEKVPQHIGSSLINGFYYRIVEADTEKKISMDAMVMRNTTEKNMLYENKYKKR